MNGSAKTYATRQMIYKDLFLNPKGLVLVGANVISQYESTIKKELEHDIPKEFVASHNDMKKTMTLWNGATLQWTPFDDEGKLRSMNLVSWYMVEGSEVSPDIFTQLKSRLRNMAAANLQGYTADGVAIYKDFRGHGVIESNPEAGWLKEKLLSKAAEIHQHGTAAVNYKPNPEDMDEDISCHISSSDSNPFLPPGYIQTLCAGQPAWWIERYIYGSFEFANGLCIPKWNDAVVPTFPVPDDWCKIVAHDPGLVDAAAFVNIAIDEKKGIAYVYRDNQYHDMGVDELYERWNTEIAYDIAPTAWATRPIMDPKMFGRRMFTDQRTLDGVWAEKGVYFQPGTVDITVRLYRINQYINSGRLKIMDCCKHLIRELPEYKFQPSKPGQPTKEKPIDRNNHSIDALEWITCWLPENPGDLLMGAYTGFGRSIDDTIQRPVEKDPLWMFRDEEILLDDGPSFEMEV